MTPLSSLARQRRGVSVGRETCHRRNGQASTRWRQTLFSGLSLHLYAHAALRAAAHCLLASLRCAQKQRQMKAPLLAWQQRSARHLLPALPPPARRSRAASAASAARFCGHGADLGAQHRCATAACYLFAGEWLWWAGRRIRHLLHSSPWRACDLRDKHQRCACAHRAASRRARACTYVECLPACPRCIAASAPPSRFHAHAYHLARAENNGRALLRVSCLSLTRTQHAAWLPRAQLRAAASAAYCYRISLRW